LAISGKGDKSRFCFECRIIQVSGISQPPVLKKLHEVKYSSHLAYLADIFGALNHKTAFTGLFQ